MPNVKPVPRMCFMSIHQLHFGPCRGVSSKHCLLAIFCYYLYMLFLDLAPRL